MSGESPQHDPPAETPVLSLMLAVPDAGAAARGYAEALGATTLWDLGSVVGLSIAGAPFFLGQPEGNRWDTPAAGAVGRERTLWLVDAAAAAGPDAG